MNELTQESSVYLSVACKAYDQLSMIIKITSADTLQNLVDLDKEDHKLKDLAELFLNAMNDWPTTNQTDISKFIVEVKKYFGTPC